MHNLEFRGRWIDIFGNVLLISILTIVTLGIYAPWGYARYQRVIATRTYYEDRPLQFDGTGGQAFVEFLIIAALSIITLGLYVILSGATHRLLRWQYAHTILPTGQRLEYRGDAIDLFFEYFLLVFFSILTLGIYSFWGYVRVRRYILSHTFLDGKSLEFEGTGSQYFIIWLVNLLLTIITFGIYALLGFATVRLLRWQARNTLVPMPERASRPMPVHSPTVSALREAAGTERTRTTEYPQQMTPPSSSETYTSAETYREQDQRYARPNYTYPESEEPYAAQPEEYDQQRYDQSYDRRYDQSYEEQEYDQNYEGQGYRPNYEEQTYRQPQDERYDEQQYNQWYNEQSNARYRQRYQEEYDEDEDQVPPRRERPSDEDESQRGYRS
jgi:hypothetical protein